MSLRARYSANRGVRGFVDEWPKMKLISATDLCCIPQLRRPATRMVGRVFACVCLLLSSEAFAEPSDLRFEALREILVREQPHTIAATLAAISERFPAYLTHHTLAYHSLSLHGSSHENPRAIVFGNTGNFIISFNGDPAHRGFGGLEVMEFSAAHGYSFRAISFLSEPNNGAELIGADEVELRTPNVLISKPNPKICASCHDAPNLRPIWEPFALWPGFYGSANDGLFRDLSDSEGQTRSADDVRGAKRESRRQGEGWFCEISRQQVRSILVTRSLPLPEGLEIAPFERKPVSSSRRRPNLALTKLFSIQAAISMVRDASAGADGGKNLTLMAASECMRSNAAGPPPEVLKQLTARAPFWKAEFRRDIAGMTQRDFDRMQDYFNGELELKIDDEFLDAAASSQPWLLAAALDAIGMNIQNYSMNVNRVASFHDGANGLFALDAILRETLQKEWRIDHLPSCAEIYEALRHND